MTHVRLGIIPDAQTGEDAIFSVYKVTLRELVSLSVIDIMLRLGYRFLFLTLLFDYATLQAETSSLVVNTTSGVFQGVSVANGTERWLGIPYAQSPVGALRFKAPAPVTTPIPGLQNAANFGNACPQIPSNLGAQISEDCLFLNIWRPEGTSSSDKLPVLAWIYVCHTEACTN